MYAHAVLGKHPHVVRYYSAWAENDHMYIQNEFCNGGSLADLIAEKRQEGSVEGQGYLEETELKRLLIHLAQGLKYIHSQGLVHLDIKPGRYHRPTLSFGIARKQIVHKELIFDFNLYMYSVKYLFSRYSFAIQNRNVL